MRRSALALGATVFALALTAGPAAAEPGVSQAVDDSIGSAQVGAVGIDAPVRVLSDGDSATTGASAGGQQTIGESTGAAQVTSVDANAPVRVLSDGDAAEGAPSGATAPEQSTADSSGSAQVGAPTASAPVRVLSDGDDTSDGATGGLAAGPQTVDRSNGSAQVGSVTVFAPARILNGGTPTPGAVAGDLLGTLLGSPSEGGGELVALRSQTAPADGAGDSLSPGALRRLVDGSDPRPAVRFISGGASAASSPDQVQTLDVSAAGLPLTGFGLLETMAMGLWLLSSGLALRLVPGGKRR
jgi:hypothetical protein